MSIELVRIDDRLIHGQVVEGWLKTVSVNHIVVISDEVARDRMQQILLGMAVPSNIKVSNYSVDAAAAKFNGSSFDGDKDRILILLSRPADAVRLLQQGARLTSVNVGGMHYSQGKRQVLRNMSVDDTDIAALREMHRRGVELEGRVLPSDERVDVIEALERELKNE
jgi:PTS system mannose-specific IIB component